MRYIYIYIIYIYLLWCHEVHCSEKGSGKKEVFKDFQFCVCVLGNKFRIVQFELYYSYVLIFYPN